MCAESKLAHMLLRARREKGYTQEELAEKCRLSLRHYQAVEAGKANPRLDTFLRICQVLELQVEDLLPAAAE